MSFSYVERQLPNCPSAIQESGGSVLPTVTPNRKVFHWVVLAPRGPYSVSGLNCLASDPSTTDTFFDDPAEFVKSAAELCQSMRDIPPNGLSSN